MAIVIDGNGTITGLNVGGLPNGIVDTDMLATNAVSNAKLAADAQRAYAHFIYFGTSDLNPLTTQSGGQQVQFTAVKSEQGMTGNTTNNHWLHSTTGYYHLYIRYRQGAGGDHWTCFGVTKNGAADCVGVSARTGSEDSHNEAYDVLYRVDSTTASYQLQGWDGGSNKSVVDPDGQGKPTWTNYDTLVGYTDTNGGVMVDIIIEKIGDL